MTENFEKDTEMNEGILQLIDNSTEIAGSTISSLAVGLLTGDPIAAAVAGIGGKALEIGFKMIGNEISQRTIGQREKVRAGAAIAFALAGIRQRLENGEKPRQDGFFDKDISGRSKNEEILENAILKCQREPEEKKTRYIAKIYENSIFEQEISADLSHKIIKSAEQLTYQQLCILSMVGRRKNEEEAPGDFQLNPRLDHSLELSKLLHDCFELVTNGYIQGGLTLTSSGRLPQYETLNPKSLYLERIGIVLFKLMDLQDIPDDDIIPIAKLLHWEKDVSSESGEVSWNPKI
ncbi:MAG: hypothetical protein OXC79_08150 [Candidatus Poribacteria bacterium]|nr:hypothetical protein [Candidatus Poribacteria bacterium]